MTALFSVYPSSIKNRGTIVDSDKQKTEVEHHPEQNELDLEFNQVEPITPKKTMKTEPSFFDKAKSLFAKKEQVDATLNTRKEPTFGEPLVAEHESHTTSLHTEDTIVPVSTNQSTPAVHWKNPETWPMLHMLPQRHRRLFVVLLGLILLLMIFFALKPSSETVQSFEQQHGQAVPIQFQPLDKQQAVEPMVLDNPVMQPQDTTENQAVVNPPVQDNMSDRSTLPHTTTVPDPMAIPQPSHAGQTRVEQTENKPQLNKPQSVVTEPKNDKIVSAEKHKAAEKPKAIDKPKPSEKPVEKAKVEKKGAPVVEAEPAKTTKGKTLTVPQGVSLMQVFRNHNLNISDVNAMTKASGAGNALSNFKAGDKVQVSVNSQGRVTELRLENGAKFIRQADGSYIYKK